MKYLALVLLLVGCRPLYFNEPDHSEFQTNCLSNRIYSTTCECFEIVVYKELKGDTTKFKGFTKELTAKMEAACPAIILDETKGIQ